MEAMIRFVVDDPSQVGSARRAVVALARAAGLDDADAGRAATVATELGTNLVKHAVPGGELLARRSDDEVPTIEIVALDHGPGGDRPMDWLSDGYTTAGSAGTGLGAVDRAADIFEIVSAPGAGTAALARIIRGGRPAGMARRPASAAAPAAQRTIVGGVSVPLDGEIHNGDAWSSRREGSGMAIVVADGLGHGEEAARASRAAVEMFERAPLDDLAALLERMDGRLHSTRGAAVAIAWLDPARRGVRYAGIGNISATIASADGTRSLLSVNGTVGQGGARPRELTEPLPPDAVFVMHSDGAKSHWTLDAYPGLARRQPTLLSAVLYRDHRRQRDDVTIVAARVP
jgi:anti-sigma regulatory factor (Ser/Thr protein kinase)